MSGRGRLVETTGPAPYPPFCHSHLRTRPGRVLPTGVRPRWTARRRATAHFACPAAGSKGVKGPRSWAKGQRCTIWDRRPPLPSARMRGAGFVFRCCAVACPPGFAPVPLGPLSGQKTTNASAGTASSAAASGRPDHPRSLEEDRSGAATSGGPHPETRGPQLLHLRGHPDGVSIRSWAKAPGPRPPGHPAWTMIVTQGCRRMVPALLKGDGDVIAHQVSITERRAARQVALRRPLGKHGARSVVLEERHGDNSSWTPPPPRDLSGKEVPRAPGAPSY